MDLTLIIAAMGFALSLVVALSNGRKDTRRDAAITAAGNARVEAKLDGISDGITDIRAEMRSMRNEIGDHGQRISKVESSASSAHHRLDELEQFVHQAHPPK